MMRHLKEIKKITWKEKVSNDEIYRRSGLASVTDILIEPNLRWTGPVHQMDAERLPRQLLYSQLSSGARNQCFPRLRFKDVAKRNLKRRDISLDTWQAGARDRPVWKTMNRKSKFRTVIRLPHSPGSMPLDRLISMQVLRFFLQYGSFFGIEMGIHSLSCFAFLPQHFLCNTQP